MLTKRTVQVAQHTTSSNSGEGMVGVSLRAEPWEGEVAPQADPLADRVAHCASVAASALEHMAERLRKVAKHPHDFEQVVEHLLEPSRAADASIEGLKQEGMIPHGTQFGATERWTRMVTQ